MIISISGYDCIKIESRHSSKYLLLLYDKTTTVNNPLIYVIPLHYYYCKTAQTHLKESEPFLFLRS